MTTPIVTFDSVEKSYGQTIALRGVSFDVQAGEIFGLLGPNGAGKSTLIRILMDIIRADKGRVLVFGEPRRREHLDRLGYLPEERGLYTKLPVIDVMTYFGALKGLSRQEARRRSLAWLEKVELPHVASWRVDRLSKGMSQKVQIAVDPAERPGGLCPRRADHRSRSRERADRRGPPGRTAAQRTDDDPVDASHEPGRVALRPRGDDQSGAADGLRRRRRGPAALLAAGDSRARARTDPGDRRGGARHRRGRRPLPPAARRRHAGARSAGRARRARAQRVERFEPLLAPDGRHLRSRGRGRDGHERLAEDQDRRDLRVPLDGEAAGLPDCDLRHAAVHGGLRRRHRHPGLLRREERPAAGRLRRGRSGGRPAPRGRSRGRRWFARARGGAPRARSGRPVGGAR